MTTSFAEAGDEADKKEAPFAMPGESPPRPYRPPQKLLVPCRCGMVVLRGLFKEGRITKLGHPLNPVFGEEHICRQMDVERT